MKFVLCNDDTYQRLYHKEYHKYVRVRDSRDFTAYFGVVVIAHPTDGDYDDVLSDLELLSDYKVIKLEYREEGDGFRGFMDLEEFGGLRDPIADL